MNMKITMATALLVCGLINVGAQRIDTAEIILDGKTSTVQTLHLGDDPTNATDDAQQHYVPFISYLNPHNNTNVMKQWLVLDQLFQTNGIRLGMTMCSMSCRTDVQARDYNQGKQIVEDAIAHRLFDNTILKLTIKKAQGKGVSPLFLMLRSRQLALSACHARYA